MKAKAVDRKLPGIISGKKEKDNLDDYPLSPDGEDIYNKFKEESDIDPEDISKTKLSSKKARVVTRPELDFYNDESGDDLDIPGSELDDEQEYIGNEDEENNYYSLGGDNHNDLEEDHDEL